jgi:hypothetical protein
MRTEKHNLHGTGSRKHEVYDMPLGPHIRLWPDNRPVPQREYWPAVTDVPCPVEGCTQTVLWYEAGYVPGYRVCMAPLGDGLFDPQSIKHRFLAKGDANHPMLVRDDCCED